MGIDLFVENSLKDSLMTDPSIESSWAMQGLPRGKGEELK